MVKMPVVKLVDALLKMAKPVVTVPVPTVVGPANAEEELYPEFVMEPAPAWIKRLAAPLVLTPLNITVMRRAQDGIPVKSMNVPLVLFCAVASVNGWVSIAGVTAAVLPVVTRVPLLAGTVAVKVPAVLGTSRVTEPPPVLLSLTGMVASSRDMVGKGAVMSLSGNTRGSLSLFYRRKQTKMTVLAVNNQLHTPRLSGRIPHNILDAGATISSRPLV